MTDSSKLGVDKLQAILPFEDLHTFITDAGAPAGFVQMLKEKGVSVLLAPIS